MSLDQHWQGLKARFDRLALRPPADAPAALLARHAATHARLMAWCHLGAGPGNSRVMSLGGRPQVDLRLAVGALRGSDDEAHTDAFANALAQDIDGSHRLAALPGRLAGLKWRLQIKANDARWWRERQPSDPWDAGWAVNTPPSMRQWKTRFMPRRATLILGDWREERDLRVVLASLVQRADDFRHPVRWLWVGGPQDLAAQPGVATQRFTL